MSITPSNAKNAPTYDVGVSASFEGAFLSASSEASLAGIALALAVLCVHVSILASRSESLGILPLNLDSYS